MERLKVFIPAETTRIPVPDRYGLSYSLQYTANIIFTTVAVLFQKQQLLHRNKIARLEVSEVHAGGKETCAPVSHCPSSIGVCKPDGVEIVPLG